MLEDDIADQAPRFALACDPRHPGQTFIRVNLAIFGMVFQERPVTVDRAVGVIADGLGLPDLILPHAGFPVPISLGSALRGPFVELERPGSFRKCRRILRLIGVPHVGCAHDLVVRFLRCEILAGLIAAFTPNPVIGACKKAHRGVACAVGKEFAAYPEFLPRLRFARNNGNDARPRLLHAGHVQVHQELQVLLRFDYVQFLFVRVQAGVSGVSAGVALVDPWHAARIEFMLDRPEARVGSDHRAAAGKHANL